MPKLKSCKVCKEKFEPLRPLQYLCGYKCATEYTNQQIKKKEDNYWKSKAEQYKKDNSKEALQKAINILVRKIDKKFYKTCICCDRILTFNKAGSVHAAHRYNVGGYENIRWNLHNIHASTLFCNKHNTEHKTGYDTGLIQRYGIDYKESVDGLDLKYKVLKLTTNEIKDKIKVVNKLIRDFDTFILTDSIQARTMFNKIIGIYL